ncbi:hypothetical protein B0T13DRAFT_166421 [Neurospora crassa]|nr:hypothetical protein B0T13DRAFT_166421 [Neurospora crassa]
MLLSLCDKHWQVMLVQGVLMGIAMGAVFKEFEKKRPAALRVVVSGSSVGDIVIPIALSPLLSNSSSGWSVGITAQASS